MSRPRLLLSRTTRLVTVFRYFSRAGAADCQHSPDYPGIRLRISTPDGVILDVDSDELHWRASCRNLRSDRPAELDAWSDLIAGGDAGTTEFSTVPLKIEVKPVRLFEVPDVPA